MTARATGVNQIKVVCETIPFFQSVSFGVWVLTGSRDETGPRNGISHFLEHLVFKGSGSKSASQIAIEIDELGGSIEAFTTRENTCFGAHVVNTRLEKAFALVAELMLASTFPSDEMELERRVILEELRSVDDNPVEMAYERLYESRFPGHPLGWPIAGSPESVGRITRDDLFEFREHSYSPHKMVVAACGDITLEALTALVERHFGHLPQKNGAVLRQPPPVAPASVFIRKELEQAHLLVVGPGLSMTDGRRMTLSLLNLILGGCVSSRLFQNIREKRGLAYSIHSFHDRYADCGIAGVYAACVPESLDEIWRLTQEEMDTMGASLVAPDELDRAKAQAQDNLKLSYESLDSRMSQIAGQIAYHGRFFSMDQILEEINAVTAEDIRALAVTMFGDPKLFTKLVVGPDGARRPWLS